VSHGDKRGLAVARQAFDADLFGVDLFCRFEEIERSAGAPGPGTQRAPVIGFTRLSFVAEPNDSFGQTRSVIGLVAGRHKDGIAPAFSEKLLLPRRPGSLAGKETARRGISDGRAVGSRGSSRPKAKRSKAEPELHH